MRPIRPAILDERDYLADLRKVVAICRAAGEHIITGMRPRWPAVHDAVAPGIEELLSAAGHIVVETDGNAIRIAAKAAGRTRATVDARLAKAVHDSLGVDITPLLADGTPLVDVMRRKIIENVDLIKSIPRQYLEQIGEAVNKGFTVGMRWESIVARIREIGDIAETRARVIARDQTSKLNAAFNEVRQTQVGIEEYSWSGVMDQRERPSHRAMEGSVQRWDAPPEVDGERVHPGEPILCRCSAIPRISLSSPLFAPAVVAEAA